MNPDLLWGLPVIVPKVMPAGTAPVGDFNLGCTLAHGQNARRTVTASGLWVKDSLGEGGAPPPATGQRELLHEPLGVIESPRSSAG